ncbi:PRC-barrel domain-containing protein [Moorella sulfitireducens]|uniref:PRC-barrel domain-containing protein n=1 Tax=Neomoorella sulfitireducens TaxID=2972948 RepID=UPI0021ACA849|nr:PRC-barrel domain-containing protein [Moorella sulfitireducens]
MFYTSKKLIGMPVVSLADGHQLGRVKRLIIDQHKMVIAAFTVDRKGWFKEQPVIPYSHVKSVGNHAITVDQAAAVVKLSSQPELEALAKHPLPLLGARVITEEGTVIGTVDDFRFDPQDGKIYYLDIKSGLLHGSRGLETGQIITCGRDALIARAGAEETLQKPAGLLSVKWQETAAGAGKALQEARGIPRRAAEVFNRYRQRFPLGCKKDGDPPSGAGN